MLFAILVTLRDKDLIKTVIVDHIQPGTIIYTDCWKAYGGAIFELNSDLNMNLEHHSETFIAEDGTCTNGIEGNWNGMKCSLVGRQMSNCVIDKKLFTFIWCRHDYENLWGALLKAFDELEF